MTQRDELKPYLNGDGFLTVQANADTVPGEGNGWLQTGTAICLIGYDEYPYPLDTVALINACSNAAAYPLIYRSPHKKNPDDNETCDDYWGALALIKLKDRTEWPKSLLRYGAANDWYFDVNHSRALRYRFDRFPAFVPCLRICAGEELSLFSKIILGLTILWDAYHIDAADGNMRSLCKIAIAEGQGRFIDACSNLWRRRIIAKYGTVAKSFEEYFGKGHPITEEA